MLFPGPRSARNPGITKELLSRGILESRDGIAGSRDRLGRKGFRGSSPGQGPLPLSRGAPGPIQPGPGHFPASRSSHGSPGVVPRPRRVWEAAGKGERRPSWCRVGAAGWDALGTAPGAGEQRGERSVLPPSPGVRPRGISVGNPTRIVGYRCSGGTPFPAGLPGCIPTRIGAPGSFPRLSQLGFPGSASEPCGDRSDLAMEMGLTGIFPTSRIIFLPCWGWELLRMGAGAIFPEKWLLPLARLLCWEAQLGGNERHFVAALSPRIFPPFQKIP